MHNVRYKFLQCIVFLTCSIINMPVIFFMLLLTTYTCDFDSAMYFHVMPNIFANGMQATFAQQKQLSGQKTNNLKYLEFLNKQTDHIILHSSK